MPTYCGYSRGRFLRMVAYLLTLLTILGMTGSFPVPRLKTEAQIISTPISRHAGT